MYIRYSLIGVPQVTCTGRFGPIAIIFGGCGHSFISLAIISPSCNLVGHAGPFPYGGAGRVGTQGHFNVINIVFVVRCWWSLLVDAWDFRLGFQTLISPQLPFMKAMCGFVGG